MIIVVDTNIVFSALLNPNSTIGEIVMNVQDEFTFVAPELLIFEIEKYTEKIIKYSKLSPQEIDELKRLVLHSIDFISEELISNNSWQQAYQLTKNIDENDTPFVALSIELNAKLWTGDKKLSKGIYHFNNDLIITTAELKDFIH